MLIKKNTDRYADVPVLIVPGFGQKCVSIIWTAPKYLSDSSREKLLISQ